MTTRIMVIVVLLITTEVFTGCSIGLTPAVLGTDAPERDQKIEELIRIAVLNLRVNNKDGLMQATASLELARQLNPDDPRVFDGLGCIAVRRGEMASAEHFFKEAILRNNSYDRAYAHLAYLAELNGEPDAARELLQLALKINPLNYRARNNYALLLADQAQSPSAEARARIELLEAYHTFAEPDVVLVHNVKTMQVK